MTRLLDLRGIVFMVLLIAAAAAVPYLALGLAKTSPWHVSTDTVLLLGKYLCFALLAIALDLVWGYCGMLSLGHGAFFALGGYAMGMYLMRHTPGNYGSNLPDFMVSLDWHQLPVAWWGFERFPYAALMVVLVPAALALVLGWLTFRSRVTGVYFSIITQAMTFALMLAFLQNGMGFGGNSGLNDFRSILGFDIRSEATRVVLFVLSATAVLAGYLVARAVTTSKYGKVLIAVRDAESRTRFLGYRVENYKLVVFVLSAMMAGVAGALFTTQVSVLNPSEFEPAKSIEAVIWVAVGGRGTLVGAALGAILVNYAKSYLTGALAENWQFVLGALFVVVVLVMPNGILGLFAKRERRQKAAPPPDPTSELIPAPVAE